jgi:hypothetical protein
MLPSNGHFAEYLQNIPGLGVEPDFQGVLSVTADIPVALTAVRGHYNQRGEYFETWAAPVDLWSTPSGDTPVLLPLIASGGGFRTQTVLFSGGPQRHGQGFVRVHDKTGNPTDLLSIEEPVK